MNRIQLTARLVEQKCRATIAHEQYLSAICEYMPNGKLYMRGVHFVAALSPEMPQGII